MRKAIVLFCCAVLAALFSGCSDYNELNMQEIVSGVGIDITENGVTVSVQTSGTGEDEEAFVYVSDGRSFFDAVRRISESSGKKLYWGHCRIAVLSENSLPQALGEICDTVFRSQDVFPDISALCASGSTAQKIIESPSGKNSSETIYDTLANAENSRRFISAPLWKIMRDGTEHGACMIPCITLSEDGGFTVSGGAVIFGEGRTSKLSADEVLAFSLISENGAGGYLPTLNVGGNSSVSLEILENDAKKKIKDGALTIEQKCVLAPGELLGRAENKAIAAAAEEHIKSEAEKLLKRAEKEGFSEIFGVGSFNSASVSCRAVISNVRGD